MSHVSVRLWHDGRYIPYDGCTDFLSKAVLGQLEFRRVEEAPDGVARQRCHRIAIEVMRKAGDEGDRAGREDGAAARRLEEDDVGAHSGVERAVDAARVRQH